MTAHNGHRRHGKYPAWICRDCGHRYGTVRDQHCATFHEPERNDPNDRCGWCGDRMRPLTEPRDYGYPEFKQ